jgi:hypothetical protein
LTKTYVEVNPLKGICTINENDAKYALNTFKNKNIKHFSNIIFLDHSSTTYFSTLGVGHRVGVQREGNDVRRWSGLPRVGIWNEKRRSLECQEEVNGMLREGKKSGIINRNLLYDEF